MAKAVCTRQFWDGPKCKMYFPGEVDLFTGLSYDINPDSIIAAYFEFPDLKKKEEPAKDVKEDVIEKTEADIIPLETKVVDKRTKEYRDSKL